MALLRSALASQRLCPGCHFRLPIEPSSNGWLIGSIRTKPHKVKRPPTLPHVGKKHRPEKYHFTMPDLPYAIPGPARKADPAAPATPAHEAIVNSEHREEASATCAEATSQSTFEAKRDPTAEPDAEANAEFYSDGRLGPDDEQRSDSSGGSSSSSSGRYKEPVVLFKARSERFKYFYAAIFLGLIPIPLYLNERYLFGQRRKMKARAAAIAKVRNEPQKDEDNRSKLLEAETYDTLILNLTFALGVAITTLVIGISLRFVTRWQYDFNARQHTVTTLSPFFKTRSFSVADDKVQRVADFNNLARVKVKGTPFHFVMDMRAGSKPDAQLFNIVLGSGKSGVN